METSSGRSLARIEAGDLLRLAALAAEAEAGLFARNPGGAGRYAGRLVCRTLCQGARLPVGAPGAVHVERLPGRCPGCRSVLSAAGLAGRGLHPAAGAAPTRLDRARALSRAEVEQLRTRDDIPIRERAFWSMLYETAARAEEVLALDIEDLDRSNRRAPVRRLGRRR